MIYFTNAEPIDQKSVEYEYELLPALYPKDCKEVKEKFPAGTSEVCGKKKKVVMIFTGECEAII